MRTVTDNLKEMADGIQDWLENLLLNHSSIYRYNEPDSWLIAFGKDYKYKELSEDGGRIQGKLLEEYRRFYMLLTALLKGQPSDTLKKLSNADAEIMQVIEQDKVTHYTNIQQAFGEVVKALQVELELLNRLYDSSDGQVVYVPDTNALLYNPDLESWAFLETSKFTIVLLPTVLSELDILKVNHRNEDVRKKAEKLIRKMKEYSRRGKLTSGVTLVRDKIEIQAIAVEPDVRASLPWLDPDNNDDRILAGVVEVMRARPRSPVLAVSRDINFQNKAEFANLPFEEPPELNR